MTQMSCPSCGLEVSFKGAEGTEDELCLRCLARSRGIVSVRLRPGARPKRLGSETRVRALLRRRRVKGVVAA